MYRLALLICLIASLFAGCGKSSLETQQSAPSQPERKMFQTRGVVERLEADGKTVRVKHEDIPGYMKAMTMPFEVKDTNELTGLAAGDTISFRMIVTEDDGWIDQVRKLDVPRTNAPPTTGKFRLVRDVEPLEVGDALPEYHFVDQDGKGISTSQFKGQALAITFLFTRCPFPNFCPLMAKNFAELQKILLSTADAPTNWHLLAITIDPEFDTPAVLKSYGARYRRDAAHWTFATGELIDITAIGEQFGLTFWHEEGSILSHNLRTVVIDPAGRVQNIIIGNDWSPAEIAQDMIKATAPK